MGEGERGKDEITQKQSPHYLLVTQTIICPLHNTYLPFIFHVCIFWTTQHFIKKVIVHFVYHIANELLLRFTSQAIFG